MARSEGVPKWKGPYEICFKSVIRGNHVYKQYWKPFLGEVLTCNPDDREEAHLQDTNALGAFKVSSEKANSENILVGHIPMEFSFLLKSFLSNDKTNKITASVIGSRKRENGLVVPCLYRATAQKLKVAMVLRIELMNTKEMCQHVYGHNCKRIFKITSLL